MKEEDKVFVKQNKSYNIFLINFFYYFLNRFYKLVINKNLVLRYSEFKIL
jgi:hypothetical protein